MNLNIQFHFNILREAHTHSVKALHKIILQNWHYTIIIHNIDIRAQNDIRFDRRNSELKITKLQKAQYC